MGFWMDKQFWIFRRKFKAAVMLVNGTPLSPKIYTIKEKLDLGTVTIKRNLNLSTFLLLTDLDNED